MKTLTREEFQKKYGEVGVSMLKNPARPDEKPAFGERTKTAASAGINKMKSAFQESKEGRNPISTGAKLAAGAIETITSPLTAAVEPLVRPTLGAGVEFVADKISDIPAVQEFAMSEAGEATGRVAETIGDVSTIAGTVAGVPAAGRVLTGANRAATGALGGVDDLSREVASVARTTAGSQPAKIMQRVARISKPKQANFEKMAGESVGEYLTKRGIYGNIDEISEKLYNRFSRSKDVADRALEKLTGVYEPQPVKTALAELLEREIRVSSPGAPSPVLARVAQLSKKLNEEGLTMTEINEVKRLFEKNVKVDYLKQNLPESVARANNIDNAIRAWQFKQAETLGLKNLPAINRETRLARQLLDDLGQEYSGSAGNNAISLTDWIIMSGDPSLVGGFLVKKTFSSKKVQSAIAKALNKDQDLLDVLDAEFGPSQVLELPAGGGGAPIQITRPINQPSRGAIESGTEIVPRGSTRSGHTKP